MSVRSYHKARGVQVCGHRSEVELNILEVLQGLTELLADFNVILESLSTRSNFQLYLGEFEASVSTAQRGRANVDAATVQTSHGDLESKALRSEHIGGGDASVIENHSASGL